MQKEVFSMWIQSVSRNISYGGVVSFRNNRIPHNWLVLFMTFSPQKSSDYVTERRKN